MRVVDKKTLKLVKMNITSLPENSDELGRLAFYTIVPNFKFSLDTICRTGDKLDFQQHVPKLSVDPILFINFFLLLNLKFLT